MTIKRMMAAPRLARSTRRAQAERARLREIIAQYEAMLSEEIANAARERGPLLWEERA